MVGKVGIVGLGLIGGSLARRLADAGVEVVAWNHTARPYDQARQAGISCVDSLRELAESRPQVLMLCNPLKAMPEILGELEPVLDRSATTLSDVGSVKTMVREQVDKAGLGDCYVGAHPMAGNEHSGFEASYARLFDDALWAVSVDEHTEYTRFLAVAKLIVEVVGCRVAVMDDAMHDRAAAMISHTPHVVATALVNGLVGSGDGDAALALAAGCWRDMTRVALTDPNRTRAMVEENGTNVEHLLRALAARLNDCADALQAGDARAMDDFFAAGQPFRDFKATEKRQKQSGDFGEVLVRHLDSAHWQDDAMALTRSGEHIVGFQGPYDVCVQRRSAL